jgi:hypothetical protein
LRKALDSKMGNESKLDHKLASLVGMLNRSSDWQAVPEIIMLTFIEVRAHVK